MSNMLDEILDEIMTDGAEPLEEKVIVVKHQKAKQRAKAKAYRMKNKSRLKMRAKKYKMRIKNKPKKKGFSYGRDGRLHRITRRKGVRKTGHHH